MSMYEQLVSNYHEHGFAVARGIFSPSDLKDLAYAFDQEWHIAIAHGRSFRHGNLYYRVSQASSPENGVNTAKPIVRLAQWPSYHNQVLEAARRDLRLFTLLEPLIGKDLKQIINQLHWKPPGSTAEFAFHQDSRFRRPIEAYRDLAISYVQTGIAIDPHTVESGAMRILPGSHRIGPIDIPVTGQVSSATASIEALESVGLDPGALVDLELAPGDVALWHPYLVHGSNANHSKLDRRFYINGYVIAANCDRGEWAFRNGIPQGLGRRQQLVHYEDLFSRPEPHYPE